MSNFNNKDVGYLKRCLELASKGKGYVRLNPLVGCVIVHGSRIIGEGYHQNYGGPHAEVNAINSVKTEDLTLLQESTLYVSLEPCCIYGKTPPCADLIVEKKIPKVVIGMLDPNPKVFKKGVEHLEKNGIIVHLGILEKECLKQNKVFVKNQTKHLPYITLKWAQSADYCIGQSGKKIQISNELSTRFSHQLRKEHDAILIGYNTALTDNPLLTDRFFHNHPIRIVLDDGLTLPENLNVFNQSDEVYTLVVNSKKEDLKSKNIKYLQIARDKNFLNNLLTRLYKMDIGNLLVEGGQKTLQLFIDNNSWDEAIVFESKKILNSDIKAPYIKGYESKAQLGDNQIIKIEPQKASG